MWPKGNVKAVADVASVAKLQCDISLEEVMGCGFGICLGCAVKVKNADSMYKMVCKDGPVFNADDIVWE